MPFIIRWTDNAYQGLQRAYDFLAEQNTKAALAAMEAIHKQSLLLKRSPNVGRPSADLDPEHRELLVPFGASGYALLYEVREDLVLILALKHQKEAGYTFN